VDFHNLSRHKQTQNKYSWELVEMQILMAYSRPTEPETLSSGPLQLILSGASGDSDMLKFENWSYTIIEAPNIK
jgi:hypothetical protein